jgi:hypothetical protein
MGFALDNSFYKKFGGDTSRIQAAINSYVANCNMVYQAQPFVKFQLAQTVLMSTATSGWNSASCGSITSKLDSFTSWRASTKRGQLGVWHLLTNCYPPPGTVGLAWIGTLCSSYATGVSTYTSTMWLVRFSLSALS